MSKRAIGEAMLRLPADVEAETAELVEQYRDRGDQSPAAVALIKHALDTPHRARAQIQAWIDRHDARHGSAVTFLGEAVELAGGTLQQINQSLQELEADFRPIVDAVLNGAQWDDVADAIEAALAEGQGEPLDYRRLPLPADYRTVLGEPY